MMNKINDESLEQVVGGATRTVYNPGKENSANVTVKPGLDQTVCFTMDNGATIETTGEIQKIDGVKWYQIELPGGGPYKYGWISGNMLANEE